MSAPPLNPASASLATSPDDMLDSNSNSNPSPTWSSEGPDPRPTLRVRVGADAKASALSFYPPSAWAADPAGWRLQAAEGGVSHTFAGEGAMLSSSASSSQSFDGVTVPVELESGWHTANYSLTTSGSVVYGAVSSVGVITELPSEEAFRAEGQRVPLLSNAAIYPHQNVQYAGEWSVVNSTISSPSASMLVNVPSNTSLFALSGSREAGLGRFDMSFSPPVLGRTGFGVDSSAGLEGPGAGVDEAQLFVAPLDPQIQYTLNISCAGARLAALHYWPVNAGVFADWRQDEWSSSAIIAVPAPPSSLPPSSPTPSSSSLGISAPSVQAGLATSSSAIRPNVPAIIGGSVGAVVLVALALLWCMQRRKCLVCSAIPCKCGHWAMLGHRYRPRWNLSKHGISSSDYVDGERRWSAVGSSASHSSPSDTDGWHAGMVGYLYEPGSPGRSLTPTTPAPSGHGHSPSPYASPASASQTHSSSTHYPSPRAMYSRPTLAESASVVSLSIGAPIPHPPPLETPPRPSFEQRVREFMGLERQPQSSRERRRSPVPPPRRVPISSPVLTSEWEPEDTSSLYSVGRAL